MFLIFRHLNKAFDTDTHLSMRTKNADLEGVKMLILWCFFLLVTFLRKKVVFIYSMADIIIFDSVTCETKLYPCAIF